MIYNDSENTKGFILNGLSEDDAYMLNNIAMQLFLINKIKEYKAPPFDENDAYYQRTPWKDFGGISSGIGMCWCWYKTDIILKTVSDMDIVRAYDEITEYYKKRA